MRLIRTCSVLERVLRQADSISDSEFSVIRTLVVLKGQLSCASTRCRRCSEVGTSVARVVSS